MKALVVIPTYNEAENVRQIVLDRLPIWDAALADQSFVTGERFTVADITAWVAIDLGIPSAFEIPAGLGHLRRWFDEVSGRPSAQA